MVHNKKPSTPYSRTAAAELFDNRSCLNPSDERAHPRVLWLCLLLRLCVGGIEETIEVFLLAKLILPWDEHLSCHTRDRCLLSTAGQLGRISLALSGRIVTWPHQTPRLLFPVTKLQMARTTGTCLLPLESHKPAMPFRSPSLCWWPLSPLVSTWGLGPYRHD